MNIVFPFSNSRPPHLQPQQIRRNLPRISCPAPLLRPRPLRVTRPTPRLHAPLPPGQASLCQHNLHCSPTSHRHLSRHPPPAPRLMRHPVTETSHAICTPLNLHDITCRLEPSRGYLFLNGISIFLLFPLFLPFHTHTGRLYKIPIGTMLCLMNLML